MRRLILGCAGLLLVMGGRAQTFSEWFQQNSTRVKYYGQQSAALEVGLSELEKGVRIASGGLSGIGAGKQGEYNLHSGYYQSLGEINPVIGQMAEVAEIVSLQVAIIQRFSTALGGYRVSGRLSADQLAYIAQVYTTVLQSGLADVAALADLLTADKLDLTDDQRMGCIRDIDLGMRDRYAFTLAFTDRSDVLQQQAADEAVDVGAVKVLYGIP